MPIQKTLRLNLARPYKVGQPVEYYQVEVDVRVDFNEATLATYFAHRCLATKTRKSAFQEGLISAQVTRVQEVSS